MRKTKIALTLATLLGSLSAINALEFGTMGSQAFGMGGVGVAINKSPWGLYYNPALLTSNDGLKVGLHFGVKAKNKNFLELFNINTDNFNENDLATIQKVFSDNDLRLSSQDGLVLQAPNLGFGAFAVGLFAKISAQGSVTATNLDQFLPLLNPNYSTDSQQVESLLTGLAGTDSLQPEINTNFNTFTLLEVPIGYSYNFEGAAGSLHLGVAAKYMNLSSISGNTDFDSNNNLSGTFKDFFKVDLTRSAQNFGIDAGVLYEPVKLFTIGLVGKYLNTPTFKVGSQTIKIDPQARAGMALNLNFFTLGLDADLTANKYLGSELKNQMIALGTAFDFKYFALRAGIAKDLQNKDDLIFSLGLGLAFLDFGIQFGNKTHPIKGIPTPDYLAFQVGAGFSF